MFFNRTIRNFQMMNRPVNRYFENRHLSSYGSELTNWNWQHANYSTPETDVLELDDQYLLELALPGVTLDDIELKIEEKSAHSSSEAHSFIVRRKSRIPPKRTSGATSYANSISNKKSCRSKSKLAWIAAFCSSASRK